MTSSSRFASSLLATAQLGIGEGRVNSEVGNRPPAPLVRTRLAIEEQIFEVPLELIVADSGVQTRAPFDPEANEEDAALLMIVRSGKRTPPIEIRPIERPEDGLSGVFERVDGHRRFEAHRLAGKKSIKAIIRKSGEQDANLMTLRANNYKKLQPVQLARAIQLVHQRYGMSFKTIAQEIGLTQRYVSELMTMLKAGEETVREVEEGRLSVKAAAREVRYGTDTRGSLFESQQVRSSRESTEGPGAPSVKTSMEPAKTSSNRGLNPTTPMLDRTGVRECTWLNPDQVAELTARVQAAGLSRRASLAAALLVGGEPRTSPEQAVELASELVQARVGRDLVAILEATLRVRSANANGGVSHIERSLGLLLAAFIAQSTSAPTGDAQGLVGKDQSR